MKDKSIFINVLVMLVIALLVVGCGEPVVVTVVVTATPVAGGELASSPTYPPTYTPTSVPPTATLVVPSTSTPTVTPTETDTPTTVPPTPPATATPTETLAPPMAQSEVTEFPPSSKTVEGVVYDVCCARMTPDGAMQYNYSSRESFQIIIWGFEGHELNIDMMAGDELVSWTKVPKAAGGEIRFSESWMLDTDGQLAKMGIVLKNSAGTVLKEIDVPFAHEIDHPYTLEVDLSK